MPRPGTAPGRCAATSSPSGTKEARGNIYGAGQIRYNLAALFANAGRINDALLYARAALGNFQQAGPGAAADAADAERLITDLEKSSH